MLTLVRKKSVEFGRNQFLKERFTALCKRIRVEAVEGKVNSAHLKENKMLKELKNKTEKNKLTGEKTKYRKRSNM
jgi:hypothetical protein